MIITTKIKMDLSVRGVVPCVDAVQDDKYSRNLEISLYDNGVAWTPPAGATAIVRVAKADGTGGNYDTLPDGNPACTIGTGNTITVRLAPQVCTAAGPVRLAVGLISNDTEINTFSVPVMVHRNPGIDVISTDYFQLKGSAGYYDLDLTETVSFATDSTEALTFDVSEARDWAMVEAAVEAGQIVRVHFMENNGVREVAVLLTDVYTVEGAGAHYMQCIYAPRGASNYYNLQLGIDYDEEYGYDALMVFIPGTASADQQVPTNISAVKADGTITVTTTLEDGSTSTSVITLDGNEYPVSIVTDGVECTLDLSGFDWEA